MTRRLRLRFILIAMAAVVVVLGIIMTAINVFNYASVTANADAILDELDSNGGRFSTPNARDTEGGSPAPREGEDGMDPAEGEGRPDEPSERRTSRWINAETPFETRYFTIQYNDNGTVINVDQIAAIERGQAIVMATYAMQSGMVYGYSDNYRYKVSGDKHMVIFVDCTRQRTTADNFLYTSLYVSAAGILGVFVLVFFFSKGAVKPMVEAYAAQKRFITEASHELKTPLAIISANNELQELECGETQSTQAIAHQVQRMTSMVKNMVSLSRLDEADTLQNQSECRLDECLMQQVDNMRATLQANERTLAVQVAEGIPYKGNVELLRQLFDILLENAAKYALTHIEVRLVKSRNGAVLTVANDAADLEDGDQSRCFERFYRSPSARETAEGNGIGLAIAQQIVHLHHAAIAAVAKDGVFTITVQF